MIQKGMSKLAFMAISGALNALYEITAYTPENKAKNKSAACFIATNLLVAIQHAASFNWRSLL